MASRSRLSRRAVLTLATLAVLAVGAAAFAAHALTAAPKATAAHPPALYEGAALGLVAAPLAGAEKTADADAGRWIAAHPLADEAAFARWAAAQVPPPPTGAAQQTELKGLHALPARTAAGDAAATWLEAHGPKDIWKLYGKQYRQLSDPTAGAHEKRVLKAALALGKTLQGQLKNHFARPSPYITDRSLNAINQGRFTRKFSYPSKHAVMAVAAATVLDRLDPLRAPELDRMLDEVLYSRLYARGHYPSDLVAGERLGRLIADFELRSVR